MNMTIKCIPVFVFERLLQVSEAGVHRPHVAGIHGRDGEGAYSIVLSGGYEDDKVSNLLFQGFGVEKEECLNDMVIISKPCTI